MKRLLSLAIIAAMALTGCNTQKTVNVADELAYDSLAWCDSVVFESGTSAKVALSGIYPKASGTALADSIRLWVLEQFCGDAACEPAQDIAETVKSNRASVLAADVKELKEVEASIEAAVKLCYEREATMEIAYDDEQYTTLAFTSYVYLAGAHGSTSINCATFRKSDGHRMDWDLLAGMERSEIAEAIKQGLCEYFEVESTDNLPECLLLGTIDEEETQRIFRDEFPLPATPPYLTADGVCIIYQQYEIACYAAGMPTCVVAEHPTARQ